MRAPRLISVAGLAVAVLAGTALPVLAAELPFPDLEVEVVELGPEPLRIGRDHASLRLERVRPGMSGSEIEALLGRPQGTASHDGVAHWDYDIRFPIAGGSSEVVCQYKVVFGADGAVASSHWRRHLCERLQPSVVPAAPPVDTPPPPPASVNFQILTLSADVLFGFGKAELTPAGRASLDAVADKLKADYRDPVITLVGHADRIGKPAANRALSQRRAEAVRAYLSRQGVQSGSMVAEGRGDSEPVVICRTEDTADLKQCLQPNRRVDIEVFERARAADAS